MDLSTLVKPDRKKEYNVSLDTADCSAIVRFSTLHLSSSTTHRSVRTLFHNLLSDRFDKYSVLTILASWYVLRVVVFEDFLIVEFGIDRLIWGFHFADKVIGRFEGEMSEVFDGYERQYCELSANLSRKCSSSGLLLDGAEEKMQKISEVKAGLDDADVLIRKMDLEARSLQPSVKAVLLAKLREYKADLNKLKREVKKISSGNQVSREELLESGMADGQAVQVSVDQRQRLAMSTERLNQSSDRIMESRRTMLETEELGVSILEDLHHQRDSLLHSHKKLHGVDDAIDKSKKILTAMSRRMSRNKLIVGSVIAALVLAIILILYFKLSHH
ncbi:hypothetical protein RHMOL_Rhmol12G0155000 [Rhododendron molle]|uniref:Uncharacterized protein n=1 Tax=Rhododendron molle TaxID=49168 RepID=A0ACC0LJP7_RHOML|nr:hypothetical protein RHMOL_Rhmol12G0155000 [Rhododendron molle]